MKEIRSIFWTLVLVVGAFVLFKVWPAYWGNFKLQRLIQDQAVALTYERTSDSDIQSLISEKAHAFNVPIAPEQVTVNRTGSNLSISVDYTVHVDLPIFPLDLNFKPSTTNHDVMAK